MKRNSNITIGTVGTVLAVAGLMALGAGRAAAETFDVYWDANTTDLDSDMLTNQVDAAAAAAAGGFLSWSSPGFGRIGWNSKFSAANTFPGWITAQGNPGSAIFTDPYNGLDKAVGWTYVWGVQGNAFPQSVINVTFVSDDTSVLGIDYNRTSTNLVVTLNELGGGPSTSAVVSGPYDEHTFRMVRQAGSATIELYVDENPTIAAQLTPTDINGGGTNRLYPVATSVYEAAYDFFGAHSGATIPEPTTLALLGVGGLVLLRRGRRA